MRVRNQRGYLRLGQRKTGPARWEFLWWDSEPSGVRVRRKAVIGTILQYPNLENAWQASNGLRVSINEIRNRQREQTITVADLIDHYIATAQRYQLHRVNSPAINHIRRSQVTEPLALVPFRSREKTRS
jgi:hypothetical protein